MMIASDAKLITAEISTDSYSIEINLNPPNTPV